MKIEFALILLLGAVVYLITMLARSCGSLSAEQHERERVRYLRDTYEQPCMTYDGNCGAHPVNSPERTECLSKCIRARALADEQLVQALTL